MAQPLIRFVSPDQALLVSLLTVARRIFTETFAHLYDTNAFEAYCDRTYATDGPMAEDFFDPLVHWRVAVANDDPIGYAKLTPLRAPALDAAPGAVELQQIYVLSEWHGTGVAQTLMDWAVRTAGDLGADELYLTVFDHNHRAKRFYARHGFEEIGRCTFTLGQRLDDDRIWRRRLR
ncbi:GNAT family N-acetyltransferase [Luteimonas sp. SDU101]|uniref:GNAT family N-acetyltransferase n=1 Tax=unclassified Luteimonas TaxID=2629088 RepID=UPI003EBBBC0E